MAQLELHLRSTALAAAMACACFTGTAQAQAAAPPRAAGCSVAVAPGGDIQHAVEQTSASGGGVVCLTPGTWTLSKTLHLVSNITLKGAGSSTVLQGPASAYSWTLIEGKPVNSRLDNVTVANLVIDGRVPRSVSLDGNNGYKGALGIYFGDADRGVPTRNLRLSGLEVRHTSMGIHIKGTDGFVLQDSHIHDNGVVLSATFWGTHNIYLRRVSNAVLSNVRSNHAWTGTGLHLADMGGDTTVRDSTFVGNISRGIHAQMSYTDLQQRLYLVNNDISDNAAQWTGSGDKADGADLVTNVGWVSGNLFTGNGLFGVLSRTGRGHGSIEGNVALDNGVADPISPTAQIRTYSGGLAEGNNIESRAPIANGTYRLATLGGGTLTAAQVAVGAPVWASAAPYTGNDGVQLWNLVHKGRAEYVIGAGTLVLTAAWPRDDEASVTLRPPNAATYSRQLWRAIPAGAGSWRLCNVNAPGVCLTGSSLASTIAPYASTNAQQWTVLAP